MNPANETGFERPGVDVNLLSPLTLRGVTLRNRIVVSPMCQYCAEDGMADDWHLVHLGSRAVGGAGLVFVEATGVVPEGRISHGCMGIWDDCHIEPLARIARFIQRMGAVAGIQLAHAGRKASCRPPWEGGASLKTAAEGGWPVVGASPIPFAEGDPVPQQLNKTGIQRLTANFVTAASRALEAGFQVIELHAAHGYLLHQFLSPLSNQRTDRYGGTLENRMRLVLEVATAMRRTLPEQTPLFVRVSATDWVDGGWDLEQCVELACGLRPLGVDLMDVSSGGLVSWANIPAGPGFQVPFAQAIRNRARIRTGAVGIITEPHQADEMVTSGAADLIFLGREMLREPYWSIKAQQALGQEPSWPTQYGYAVRRRKP
jgi:2,4-dienoyl-CoA reductase-like NADH-dependent reductase (Old Yellow Enzyme family)